MTSNHSEALAGSTELPITVGEMDLPANDENANGRLWDRVAGRP